MTARRPPLARARRAAVVLAAIALLLAVIGLAPVNRTQEARVLETAREMAGHPAVDWLIPHMNGHPRLRKPPMAYWLSAASFEAFGINDWAGRLPAALAFAGTLAFTYAAARRLFGRRAAVYAVWALPGTWLAFKEGLLAETDGYATLGVTAGVYAVLRAMAWSPLPVRRGRAREGVFGLSSDPALSQTPSPTLPREYTGEGATRWTYAVALALAFTILSKGPPAAYVLLFWVGLSAIYRDWRSLARFVTRGGLFLTVVLAVPWFVYVARHSTAEGQLGDDLLNSADGGDHHGPPWAYLPLLLQATLPWTFVWLAAAYAAAERIVRAGRRRVGESASREEESPSASSSTTRRLADSPNVLPYRPAPVRRVLAARPGLVVLLLWAIAILLPLSCWGNKQFHYLLPVMPPTAILIGWGLAGAVRGRGWARPVAVMTPASGVILAIAVIGATAALLWHPAPHATPAPLADVLLAVGVLASLLALVAAWRSVDKPRSMTRATAVLAVTAAFLLHAWYPASHGSPSRRTALRLMADYPQARFGLRGNELPVVSWSMRRAVPALTDAQIAAAPRDLVLLDQQQSNEDEPTAPAGYVEVRRFRQRENTLHAYAAATGPLAGPRVDVDVR